MSIEILEVNGLAALQRADAWGRRHFGVPEGGAWDSKSADAANAMVGNPSGTALLELSMARLVFRTRSAVWLGTSGAPAPIRTGRREFQAGETVYAEEGEVVEIGVPATLARSYLAVPGGFTSLPVGVSLRPGQVLQVVPAAPGLAREKPYMAEQPPALSVCPSDPQLIEELVRGTFTVGFRSNRVGIRLEGPRLDTRPEMLSEPACHGLIQLDNSGSPIILGPDGPTIGGYPKIGVVASRHLHHLGQLRPGAEVKFQIEC